MIPVGSNENKDQITPALLAHPPPPLHLLTTSFGSPAQKHVPSSPVFKRGHLAVALQPSAPVKIGQLVLVELTTVFKLPHADIGVTTLQCT